MTAETGPAIDVSGVDFSYGHVQVLFGVDLHASRGEVLALLGTNGAGKSTLLRVVSGLERPSAGTVTHHGDDITDVAAVDRVRRGIVQLPGGKAIFPSLSVMDNLVAGAWTHIWDRPAHENRIGAALARFPVLHQRLDQPAGTLSGGEQQMLALAKALLIDPDVLCIDELSLGLAPVVVQQLLAIVEELRAGGLTMIIVEQSLNVALALADRAVPTPGWPPLAQHRRVDLDRSLADLPDEGDVEGPEPLVVTTQRPRGGVRPERRGHPALGVRLVATTPPATSTAPWRHRGNRRRGTSGHPPRRTYPAR